MSFALSLTRFFSMVGFAFLVCVTVAAIMEDYGVARQWIGYFFIFVTLGAYAVIGMMSRTSNLREYFVASRSVPAIYNGMATAADWMSAASFLGVAGTLYYNGFEALAFLVGWTGGFVLIALLIAPYLRKFDFFSVGDFLAARYRGQDNGKVVRLICIGVTISISFVYVIAQIYAVGLITSRFAGVEFGIGVFFGLAGILVCSFLGGMRAVTWTEVAQYLVMIVAMAVTVVALFSNAQQSRTDWTANGQLVSFPQYIQDQEKKLNADPAELQVRHFYQQEAQRYQLLINGLPLSWSEGFEARRKNLEMARYDGSTFKEIKRAERVLSQFPATPEQAKKVWQQKRKEMLERVKRSVPHYGRPSTSGDSDNDKGSFAFLAVVFSLMCGTVALPHIIMRFFTTPDAKQTRWSVVYALGFILVLYLAAPWLASLAKLVVYEHLVGLSYAEIPNWVSSWSRVLPGLASMKDVNHDGIVQFAEIAINPDILVLVTPEIAGLPFFLSGLIAAGGLAAALSTADGLLLAIANSLAHDLYFRIIDPEATAQRRVTMSKICLLGVALCAAWVTSMQPGNIVAVVGSAFVMAGSSLFVPLVAGIFWQGASRRGAVWSMAVGFFSAVILLGVSSQSIMGALHLEPFRLFGVDGLGCSIFTIPLSALAMFVMSRTDSQRADPTEMMRVLRAPEQALPELMD